MTDHSVSTFMGIGFVLFAALATSPLAAGCILFFGSSMAAILVEMEEAHASKRTRPRRKKRRCRRCR